MRLYPLSGVDGNETKIWYMLSLNIRINFFYENEIWDNETRPRPPVPLSTVTVVDL